MGSFGVVLPIGGESDVENCIVAPECAEKVALQSGAEVKPVEFCRRKADLTYAPVFN